MKTVIYYFSGTGNSLAVAKSIAKELDGEVELLPIAGHNQTMQARVSADRLGLVFPVRFLSVPEVVRNFVQTIHCNGKPYVFAVATCNAVPGHTLYTMERLLKRRGLVLSAGFAVDMPGNIIMNPTEVQQERLERSKNKIPQMVLAAREGRSGIMEGSNAVKWYIEGGLMRKMAKLLMPPSKRFQSNANCTRCGLCAKVCPAKNIKVDPHQGPVWGKDCAYCMACFHWCPNHAIEMNGNKMKLNQYHHPEVKIEEIVHAERR